MRRLTFAAVAAILVAAAGVHAGQPAFEHPQALRVVVTYDDAVADTFTGRVYVMLSNVEGREPRFGPNWVKPKPFFALDVDGWQPGAPLVFDDTALSYPSPLGQLPRDQWSVQAVMRRNLDSPFIGSGEGTAYSEPATAELDGTSGVVVELVIDRVIGPRPPIEAGNVEIVRLPSKLLSEFHGREIVMEAAVILPPGHDESSDRRYPALYVIPGFGGDHTESLAFAMRAENPFSSRIVKIGLNSRCRTGHHAFANSENNGPWGDALVTELIPHLEANFPLIGFPSARFLTGASSGGWSALWLQVTYPDSFAGVWALVPDPVDFRAFQSLDIYEPGANAYIDAAAERRPIIRRRGETIVWVDDFAAMETVIGEGGQLTSFEAVFSPRGPDRRPMPLFNRVTGAVDPAVAEAWKRYDIRLVLEERWQQLAAKLAGKIHVFAAEDDNFFLEDAVKLLRASLERLQSDAMIEVYEGRNHTSLVDAAILREIDRELYEIFVGHHGIDLPRR